LILHQFPCLVEIAERFLSRSFARLLQCSLADVAKQLSRFDRQCPSEIDDLPRRHVEAHFNGVLAADSRRTVVAKPDGDSVCVFL
jgi:hypothetical protein